MNKLSVLLGLFLLLAVACRREEQPQTSTHGYGGKRAPAPATATTTGTEVGSLMPEYSAMWLDGSKFELESRRDKVVLLNVWATWCGPCVYEIPELQAIHDKYAPRKFEVIGVSVDESGVESVSQFVNDHKMKYPIALDPDGKLANMLQTSVLPTTVLVDRSGKIVWKRFGAIMPNDPELTKAIEEAL
ncbi:MAG TPA: TlpA disulfide reductase family protein [Thermoanaerobaculia bacterium]|jgi:thiol-disulfide isomerase/thioredoxin